MKRLTFPLAGLFTSMLLFAGCGPDRSHKFTSEELDQMAKDRRKAIADDKTMSDEAAIKKLISNAEPSVKLRNGKAFCEVLPIGAGIPGYLVEIKRYDRTFFARSTPGSDFPKLERDGLKDAAEFCEEMLTLLKDRGLKGIRYQLFTTLTNEAEDYEVFRATVTDISKLEKARGNAEVGSVFDPRCPKVGEIWKVEKNDYPLIEYTKKK